MADLFVRAMLKSWEERLIVRFEAVLMHKVSFDGDPATIIKGDVSSTTPHRSRRCCIEP